MTETHLLWIIIGLIIGISIAKPMAEYLWGVWIFKDWLWLSHDEDKDDENIP